MIHNIIEPFKIAYRVSADARSFVELTFVMLLAHANRRKTWLRRFLLCRVASLFLAAAREKPFAVRLKCNGRILNVMFPYGHETEFWSIRSVIHEVLINEVYRLDGSRPVSLVIDAGANCGLATLYLQTLYPDAFFICYEPSSDTFPTLVRNLEENDVNFKAFRKAITNYEGTACFGLGRSSMERAIVTNAGDTSEEVECVTLRAELDRLGIEQVDLLKFDVEGEEMHLLQGLGSHLSRIVQLAGETHGPELERAVREHLHATGFRIVQQPGHIKASRLHENSRPLL